MELILYTSNSTGVASNCLYPNRAVITDSAGLVAAGKFDQVFAKYKDNYRTATEKMTTPQAMVTTAEKNVTTPADNSKISYKHETFYILFKFANSVKAPKAQIRKKRGKAKHYLKSPRVTY